MKEKEDLLKEKMALVEELGVHFECNDNLSPLASRIIVYLILNGAQGATFEELVDALKASKSSISTNLHLLQSMDRISYFTKCGDRKRYFKLSSNYIMTRMTERISLWENEKNNHLKIYNYKEKMLKLNNEYKEDHVSLQFNKQHMVFISKMITNLKELKQNLLTIINNEENEKHI
ncbi:MarR family transcriptional regulator [Lutibacter sp. A80]|uniref:GbsR/MarR family transcriptional regulator n=1 Tax=Lutibacter sp. A80 TaxID=2918453 RepID=UPI001F06F6E7|nr:MarR family transcriptional regulator [Lutibacter sp. A80]UMB59752.1 MarR family transcriptional regulator [Lutibacter sp. A80]